MKPVVHLIEREDQTMKNKFFRALFPAAILGLSIMLTAYAANSSNAAETTASESTAGLETAEASDVTDGAAGVQDTSSDEWYSDRDMEQMNIPVRRSRPSGGG